MQPSLRPLAKRVAKRAAAPLGVKIVGTQDWSNTRDFIPFERTINAALNPLLSRILPITRRITTRVNQGVTGISRCAGAAWGALVAVRSQVPGGFLTVLLAPGWGLRVTVSRWQRAYWKKMRSLPRQHLLDRVPRFDKRVFLAHRSPGRSEDETRTTQATRQRGEGRP